MEGDLLAYIRKHVNVDNLHHLLADLGLLPGFVRRLLIRHLTADILPSKEEQIAYQKSFFANQKIVDKDSLSIWLEKNNFIEADMTLHLYRSLQEELLKARLFSDKVEPFFVSHKSDFDLCYFSMLRTKSRESISELFFRLAEHEDTFSSLATQYSVGSESQSNGYIGPRPFSSIHPELAERLRISQPGQLWEPFQVDSHWCIIRLERIITSSLDSQVYSRILNTLFDNWLSKKVDDLIEKIDLDSSPPFAFDFNDRSLGTYL